MVERFAAPWRAVIMAGLLALLPVFAAEPSLASCFAPDQLPKATVSEMEASLTSLLAGDAATNVSAIISTVRDLAASDPGSLSFILAKLDGSNDSQRSSIGTGLGQAATICQRPDLPYATDIQTQLLASDKALANQSAEIAFALATGQEPIGATGGAAGGGGFSSGGSGGPVGGFAATGLSGPGPLQGIGSWGTKTIVTVFTLTGNGSTSYTGTIARSVSTP
jgi:hypothetical protein